MIAYTGIELVFGLARKAFDQLKEDPRQNVLIFRGKKYKLQLQFGIFIFIFKEKQISLFFKIFLLTKNVNFNFYFCQKVRETHAR